MDIKTPLLPPRPDEPSPWAPQSGENEKEYAAFKLYLDQPPPRRIIRPGTGDTQTLCNTARRWRWFERARARDAWMQEVLDIETEARLKVTARERAGRHLAFLDDALELVSIEFYRLLRRAKEGNFDGTIKVGELIRLADLVVGKQRLVQGESTENVVETKASAGELSIEELRTLNDLAEKMKSDPGKPTIQ